jgi:hypothetical protein
MMRRVVGRALVALGGRDAGFGRGRLAHLLPLVVVGLMEYSTRNSTRAPRGETRKHLCTVLIFVKRKIISSAAT